MIHGQGTWGEGLSAILAGVAVAKIDVRPAEGDSEGALGRLALVADHGGDVPGHRGGGNRLIVGRQGLHALFVDKFDGDFPPDDSHRPVP